MLISHNKKFIYTKTSKTAGTSVEVYFEKHCLPEGEWELQHYRDEHIGPDGIIGYRGQNPKNAKWYNHMPAEEIKEKIGTETWDEYYKFCVVRNPYDKLISQFFHKAFSRRHEVMYRIKRFLQSRKFLSKADRDDPIKSFRIWLQNGGPKIDRDKYIIDDQICIDFFITYENLFDGIKEVCEKLDIPFDPDSLPTLKKGFRKTEHTIKDFYDETAIKKVKELYALEIEKFNYEIPE